MHAISSFTTYLEDDEKYTKSKSNKYKIVVMIVYRVVLRFISISPPFIVKPANSIVQEIFARYKFDYSQPSLYRAECNLLSHCIYIGLIGYQINSHKNHSIYDPFD